MEEMLLSPNSTLKSSEATCSFPPHRRRPLRSRTYDTLIQILSHCRPHLQMQGSVREGDGSITCHQVITTNIFVSDPNSKGSEDKSVRETSDGETKGETDFQVSEGKQAATAQLHQPELVRDSEQELNPSNQISVEDYLVVDELIDDRTSQNTKELENVNTVLDIDMADLDTLKDVGLEKGSCFHHSSEALQSSFGLDTVVESSKARQLGKESDSVLGENIQKDAEHEVQMKEMELEKLIYGTDNIETPSCHISEEIEEGEISGDAEMADESFDAVSEGVPIGEETTENLHASVDSFNRVKLPFQEKGGEGQKLGVSGLSQVNIVNIDNKSEKVKSRIPSERLQDFYYQDDPRRSQLETPNHSDLTHCLDNLTPFGRILQDNAAENEISLSTKKDENAGKNKRKRVLTKERRDKKKKKERIKRAAKNREEGIKRLKLPPVLKPKKIVHCRHYLHGRCHEGEKCKFSHDTVPLTKSKPCGHFARGSCMKGDQCPYDHELSKYPCNNYTSNGFCNRGSECMFSHEMPAKSLSPTANVSNHDLISPQQTVPEKQGSYPISKVKMSELKSPSPLEIMPMDSSGISHQKVNSRLRAAPNSPAQREQLALKPILRTGGQAPRGISFLLNGAVPLGNSNTGKQEGSSAKSTDGAGAGFRGTLKVPGVINESNEAPQGVVAQRKPQGINFLSFTQPPSDDSSSKLLSNLLSNHNDEAGKSTVDYTTKEKLTCSLDQGANRQMNQSSISLVSADVNGKANVTPLTEPQNVKFLPFDRSHLDVSTSKEKAHLALPFGDERESTSKLQGGWNASTPGLVRKAVQSTLAFAAQLQP